MKEVEFHCSFPFVGTLGFIGCLCSMTCCSILRPSPSMEMEQLSKDVIGSKVQGIEIEIMKIPTGGK